MPRHESTIGTAAWLRMGWLRRFAGFGLVLAVVATPAAAHELPPPGSHALRTVDPLPGDDEECRQVDAWAVSTRRLPGICRLPAAADLAVERCVDADRGRWERDDLANLLALDDPARPLLVFIHGNRYESGAAKSQGVLLARHCAACCPGGCRPRVVVFSWPSGQQGILLRDGRAKYERAYADGHYLAWFLGQVPPERPVAIVGYSFGALITLEALEDLVAAERSGRGPLLPWTNRPGRTHLVFIAPAVRCDALAPRGPYAETLACFDRLTLVVNSQDDALRFFPWLDRNLRVEALGKVGMPRRWAGGAEFSTIDAAPIVGRQHGLPLYLTSPVLTRRIAAGALESLAP
jgi:hypothetical protein